MIERSGFTIHVDSPSERTAKSHFRINGWVTADETVDAIWVPTLPTRPLAFYERPDVVRVFPSRPFVRGFSGKGRRNDLGREGLLLGVRVGGQIFELEHPLPPSAPVLPFRQRFGAVLKLASLAWRAHFASAPSTRWRVILQRHLLLRELRSNIFRREHTDALLANFAKALPEAVFVQIGANDGLTGDPLPGLLAGAGSQWRGVMVEPIGHLFTQLCDRYGSRPGLRLENAAVGEADGTITIHRIRTEPGDPLWLEQLASLDRDVLQRNAGQFGHLPDRIVSEDVACVTVSTLLQRHQIQSLDLLLIDTEGWDWRVLRQFDLARLKPKLILYEHQHLSPGEKSDAHTFLGRHGYEWAETPEGDTIAWRLRHS
jgi:FkbM family methyltransferase